MSKKNGNAGSYYYPLFAHMAENHGLILLESEMNEIERVVLGLKRGKPSLEKIVDVVSGNVGVAPELVLRREDRTRALVKARWFVMQIAIDVGHSRKEVAELFKMDHTTIIHGLKALLVEIEMDRKVKEQFDECVQQFKSSRQAHQKHGLATGNEDFS